MITFTPHPEIAIKPSVFNPEVHKTYYSHDYQALFKRIAEEPEETREQVAIATMRYLIKNDLFFVAHFVMENPLCNHPFGVAKCRMVEEGPKTKTLDVWARGHLKSWIITQAETVQRIVQNPEETHVIFSYKKPKAEDFLSSIKRTLEKPLMVKCFPDILWENPDTQNEAGWSIQGGITVKRKSVSRKERTVETYGVIEGMPTGGHWDRRIYDDIETADLAKNPEQLEMLIYMFNMSHNLGAPDGVHRVIGTYYSHCGLLVHLKEKKTIHGDPMYQTRIVPATEDGTKSGKPVFLSQESLDDLKSDSTFNSQQLCNPTPQDDIKLPFNQLLPIEPKFMPKNRLKFIIVDPAGDDDVQKGTKNDKWAIGCISVKPDMDELGNSDIYLEDCECDTFGLGDDGGSAVDAVVNMHLRNGRIIGIGVEKVATDSSYKHIQRGLIAKRKKAVIKKTARDNGNLVLLTPAGKTKARKIETALSYPWFNGKIHYSTRLSQRILDMLKSECDRFPWYHVDILDMLSYIYQLLEALKFQFFLEETEEDDEDESPRLQAVGRSKTGGY